MNFVQWFKKFITGSNIPKNNSTDIQFDKKEFPIPIPEYGTMFRHVEIRFNADPLYRKDVDYVIKGPSSDPAFKDDVLDGTYSCSIWGRLESPEEWKGYSCELELNTCGSSISDHSSNGKVGYGQCRSEKHIFIRITVLAAMAKDFIEHTMYLSKEEKGEDEDEKFTIRVDIEDLKLGSLLQEKPAIFFNVSAIWLQ